MTFEEWWAEQHYGMRLFSFTSEETARAAWQAAQQAERERCARVASKLAEGERLQRDEHGKRREPHEVGDHADRGAPNRAGDPDAMINEELIALCAVKVMGAQGRACEGNMVITRGDWMRPREDGKWIFLLPWNWNPLERNADAMQVFLQMAQNGRAPSLKYVDETCWLVEWWDAAKGDWKSYASETRWPDAEACRRTIVVASLLSEGVEVDR